MLKTPVGAKFIAVMSKFVIRSILFTCKFEIQGFEQFNATAKDKKCILMVWHNRLALVAEILNRYAPQNSYAAVVSKSRDAEPLALLASSYKGKTIRVSHDARYQALRKMMLHLKQKSDVIIITPDGPRGPRYEVKPGIAVAARQSKAHIFPLAWSATKFWQLGTWDKMILPKPFSTISVRIGDSVQLNEDADGDLSHATAFLEKTLQHTVENTCQSLTSDIEKWPL
jgi:lysophospholipid acyltransferase (LPLAT)-like uncharacterized protein